MFLRCAAGPWVSKPRPSAEPLSPPSTATVQITRCLRDAANIIGIDLLDHVIVGDAKSDPRGVGYYSFREACVI